MLPLVQFYLEEGISDEEAVSLIDLEVPQMDQRDAHWQDMDNGGILCVLMKQQKCTQSHKLILCVNY